MPLITIKNSVMNPISELNNPQGVDMAFKK